VRVVDALKYGVFLVVLIAVAAMLFGQALGQPILLAYVETGSMAPTLEPGDGFIAVPMAVAGPPEEGDVVVFEAQELQGGGLTTHRIVGRTEEGFITQGDANSFTDQASVEPPVTEDRIVAKALTINGQVVAIRNLGDGIVALQNFFTGAVGAVVGLLGLGAIFAGAGPAQTLIWVGVGLIIVTLIADAVTGNRSGRGSRSRRRPSYYGTATFLVALAVIVLAPATASMVLPSGSTSFDIVSSESPNESPLVIASGETTNVNYTVANDGFIPTMTVIEPEHPDLEISRSNFIVSPNSQESTTLRIRAPDETGAYTRSIGEYRYLPVLPRSMILSLHEAHPYVAVAAIDLLLLVFTLLLGLISVGVGPIRLRSTGRSVTLVQQLKRRFL